jgi:hypothetical protein
MHLTRRHFLKDAQLGIGAIALSSLLARDGASAPLAAAANPLASKQPHFPAHDRLAAEFGPVGL